MQPLDSLGKLSSFLVPFYMLSLAQALARLNFNNPNKLLVILINIVVIIIRAFAISTYV